VRWPVALAVALLAVALAGCGGKDSGANQVRLGDGQRISLDLPEEQQPAEDDIRGAVSGIVVNEAIFPVLGATVSVRDRDTERVTDADGKFVLEAMPPGLYTLEVHMPGHAEGLGTINVKSGQVVKSILQIHRLPVPDPYHTTYQIEVLYNQVDGFVQGSPEHLVPFDMQPATVILEAVWTGLTETPGGDLLVYEVRPESKPESYQSGGGPNPLRVQFDPDFFPADEYAVRFTVHPSMFAVAPETRGQVFLTMFYVDPAPDGWSIAAGDA
jgi:hypothetical protein